MAEDEAVRTVYDGCILPGKRSEQQTDDPSVFQRKLHRPTSRKNRPFAGRLGIEQ